MTFPPYSINWGLATVFITIPRFIMRQVSSDIAYLVITFVILYSTKISETESKFLVIKPVLAINSWSIPPIVSASLNLFTKILFFCNLLAACESAKVTTCSSRSYHNIFLMIIYVLWDILNSKALNWNSNVIKFKMSNFRVILMCKMYSYLFVFIWPFYILMFSVVRIVNLVCLCL